MNSPGDRRALAYGLAAVLAWSTVATAFKLALRELHILQLLAYASLFSAAALLLILRWQGKTGLLLLYLRKTPGHFFLMGLLNPVLYYLMLLRAYELLPAQQAQAINYSWAIMLAVLGVPLLGHRLSGRDVLAVCMGYCGVLVIATRGRVLALEFTSVEGVLWALASTVVWALYWLLCTRDRRDPVVCLCLNFLLATPVLMALCAGFSSLLLPAWKGIAGALYIGLFEMGVTFALWSTALRRSSSVSRVGNLIFLSPLISMVFIAGILGEAIHAATLIGLSLIIPAVVLQQNQRVARPEAV